MAELVFSDPSSRAVAEDALRESGRWSLRAWQWRLGFRAHADAHAHADADAYAYADADANAHADAHAHADADADAYADADADANANADAHADADASTLKENDMRDGLYAVQLWSGSLMVLRVGWFRREAGDDYDVWWTTPYRDGYQVRPGTVWAEGPKKSAKGWTWSPVLESSVSRLHFVPLAKLDPALWESVCPRPKGWDR